MDSIITALGKYWAAFGLDWDRRFHPQIRAALNGYHKLRPPIKRERRPFTIAHLLAVRRFLPLHTYDGTLIWSALLIGYFWGGRSCEYTVNESSDWYSTLQRSDLQFIYSSSDAVELILDFRFHKANKWGLYDARVAVACTCGDDLPFCPVHDLLRFVGLRDALFGSSPLPQHRPLLIQKRNGMPMMAKHLNNAIKYLIARIGLNEDHYASHSLRSGRATDLARSGKPAYLIQKWGRWRSDCWKEFYLKLCFTDIAVLTKSSLHSLGLADTSTPLLASSLPAIN